MKLTVEVTQEDINEGQVMSVTRSLDCPVSRALTRAVVAAGVGLVASSAGGRFSVWPDRSRSGLLGNGDLPAIASNFQARADASCLRHEGLEPFTFEVEYEKYEAPREE